MEFVSKKRKLKITIDGTAYEMAVPSIGEQQELDEKLKSAQPEHSLKIYLDFFEKKGVALEALKSLEMDDFLELTKFVFNPKKSL
jgi:hypothetical protein